MIPVSGGWIDGVRLFFVYRVKPEDLYDNPLVFQNGSLVRCSCLPVAFEIVINENADNQDKEKTDKKDRKEIPNQEQAPDENQEERGNGNDIPQQFFDEDDFFGDYYGGENNDGFGSLYDFFF